MARATGARPDETEMAWHDPISVQHRRRGWAHARLGYAGGSRRSSETSEFGDPKAVGLFKRQLAARNLGNRRNATARKDANHKSHVRARLIDVLVQRVVIVINRMLVNCSIGMPMSDDVTMAPILRMIENEAQGGPSLKSPVAASDAATKMPWTAKATAATIIMTVAERRKNGRLAKPNAGSSVIPGIYPRALWYDKGPHH